MTAAIWLLLALSMTDVAQAAPFPAPTRAPPPTGSARCDRACLEDVADRYVAALGRRDSSIAPFARTVRFTENGQVLKLGDALWGTVERSGDYRLVIADIRDGTIGLFQVMYEASQPVLLAARLAVVNRQITELETIVSRAEPGSLANPQAPTRQIAFSEEVAEGERVSTTQLRNIANAYFDGLVQGTDTMIPFAEHCFRIENGARTANNQPAVEDARPLDCRNQYATGLSRYLTDIRERRVPVVDEERGLVLAVVFLDHAGVIAPLPGDQSTVAMRAPFNRPYSFQAFELFKVADGRIAQIETVLVPAPYGMPSNWGDRRTERSAYVSPAVHSVRAGGRVPPSNRMTSALR